MPYKINILQYSLVTLVTLVWFLPSMIPHMYVNEIFFHHYASSYGLLNYPSLWNLCHIALIWFLPRMYFEMTCKITIPWKGLVTLTAVICFIRNVFCFSSKCIFKWLVKLLFLEKRLITLTALIFFIQNAYQIFRKSQFIDNAIEH